MIDQILPYSRTQNAFSARIAVVFIPSAMWRVLYFKAESIYTLTSNETNGPWYVQTFLERI